jgi:hypothetical protein
MRTMKVSPFPVFLKGNGRTGTFHHNTSHGNEQRLYPRPFNVSTDRVGKYGFKGFPVFANHRRMITQYDITSTLFLINIYDQQLIYWQKAVETAPPDNTAAEIVQPGLF